MPPNNRINPQPPPKPSSNAASWDLVVQDTIDRFAPSDAVRLVEDMRARDDFGAKKYGVRLQANNGRDTLVDLYQEVLDAVVYAKTYAVEHPGDGVIEDHYDHLLKLLCSLRWRLFRRDGK